MEIESLRSTSLVAMVERGRERREPTKTLRQAIKREVAKVIMNHELGK
jgi:hypothetical protein